MHPTELVSVSCSVLVLVSSSFAVASESRSRAISDHSSHARSRNILQEDSCDISRYL